MPRPTTVGPLAIYMFPFSSLLAPAELNAPGGHMHAKISETHRSTTRKRAYETMK